jgi:hypothetical protein
MQARPSLTSLAVALAIAATGPAPHPAGAQSADERLSVHGFLTQAYGRTDGNQVLGLPSQGTSDYRVAALQFRFDADVESAFVLQLSHERLGRSPLTALEPAVDLDWVFYERRFGEHTIARVGKVRTPLGLFNEIRDVGTLLALYRPPVAVYGEQVYASETVNGAMVGHRIPMGDWALDLNAFYGSWNFVQYDLATYAEVDGGYGGQAWIDTPIDGVRVGAGHLRYSVGNLVDAPADAEDDHEAWIASLQGEFTRFSVRSELFHASFGETDLGYTGTAERYYVQAVVNVTDWLGVVGQAEFEDLAIDVSGPFGFSFDGNENRDLAVGLRYAPAPNVVVKLEGHLFRGYRIEDGPPPYGAPQYGAPRARVKYALLSVSTSF